jgi:hypothetical protein
MPDGLLFFWHSPGMTAFLAPEEYAFVYLRGTLMTDRHKAVTGHVQGQLRLAG